MVTRYLSTRITALFSNSIAFIQSSMQTTSFLAHECILHARTMGLKAVFTDHSLFSFGNAASIHINKFMKFTLSDIDHIICVSHTSRENLVLRAHVDPALVSTIPNAVDTTKFVPNPSAAPPIKDRTLPLRCIRIARISTLLSRHTESPYCRLSFNDWQD